MTDTPMPPSGLQSGLPSGPPSTPPSGPPSTPPSGLSTEQARAALAQHGPNAITDREHHGLLRTLTSVAAEPMFLLLLVAAAIYLVLGDLAEGLLLAVFALLTVGLVIFQERRSEHALDALRELSSPQVRVRRDGREQRIPARDLVPGDLFLLGEGERVAADGLLREGTGLMLDESLLTGESVPLRKQAWAADASLPRKPLPSKPVPDTPRPGTPLPDANPASTQATAAPGGEDTPEVLAGTLVVAGHGLAQVTATGRHTQVGQIGSSLAAIETTTTPLQQQLRRLVQVFGGVALVASGALVLWYGLLRGDWMQGLLSAIALGMAMLPEEFPMALTVFLALGAWRLARIQVLARRPAVIEALGAASVLCVDKTGTLTENRMRVHTLACGELQRVLAPAQAVPPSAGQSASPPEGLLEDLPEDSLSAALEPALARLLGCAAQASRRGGLDPMDRALHELADAQATGGAAAAAPAAQPLREYPLTPELPATALVWPAPDGGRTVAAKGAPEAILRLCRLPAEQAAALQAQVQRLADGGLRVLAVARASLPAAEPDHAAEPALAEAGFPFELLGLVGFQDPLRADVPAAVAQARQAGITVAMITGDHAATALAIARQAGIDVGAGALTGSDIAALDDAALASAVRRVRVYARVLPAQKQRLVEAFRHNGETVAMTGDGVNDAPALKAAHIGIAMGVRGTDVAREAAGLVLLDEDFGRIVGGVRMGRRIFDNLRKVMVYITAIHVPVAGLALLPVLLGWAPLLLPAHVVLTEMVIDPVCSLAFEGAPEDPRIMQRPPRRADDGLVGWRMLVQGLLQGGALLAVTLAIFALALQGGRSTEVARTLAILGLTVGNLLLVAVNLTVDLGWRVLLGASARAFWAVSAAAAGVLALALAWPAARRLLHFGVPSALDLGAALLAVVLAVGLGALLSRMHLVLSPRPTLPPCAT